MEIDQTTLADFNKVLKESKKDENNMVIDQKIKNTMAKYSDQLSNGVLPELLLLKAKIGEEGPQKILLTLAGNKDDVVTIHHSIPFILTNDKLILLRNEDDEFGQKVYNTLAEKLGTKLVQGREPEYNKEKNSERGVMQADHTSCHFLALGILKDLTKEDLKQVSAFEKNFDPLPKSLKYSQSSKYIENSLSKEGKAQAVKTDDKTALQYVKKNKIQEGDQIITRITTKSKKFKSQLNQAIGQVGENFSPNYIAAKILENQKNAKSEKSSGPEVALKTSPRSSPRATTTSAPFPPPEIGGRQ